MPFDFDAVSAPFRMQPGLRRLAPGALQLTPNRPDSPHFLEKLAALRDHPWHALLCAPGFDPGPALSALAAEAAAAHPKLFFHDGAGVFEARVLGWSVVGTQPVGHGPAEIGELLHALAPDWRLAALLSLSLAQDFAVIDGATARIPWLAVCLPSRWAPETKVGRHFAEVHAPVADNQLLTTAADHLARLVTGPTRWERFVWTISSDARLMQHPVHAAPAPWHPEPDLAASAIFRTEHQTFIPLPSLHQAVFTIEVETRPLAQAIDSPERAARLHAALASMGAAVLAYRGLTAVREPLLDWLAMQSR